MTPKPVKTQTMVPADTIIPARATNGEDIAVTTIVVAAILIGILSPLVAYRERLRLRRMMRATGVAAVGMAVKGGLR